MPTKRETTALAREALAHWPQPVVRLRLIQHLYNSTYRATFADGADVLVRVTRPVVTEPELQGELAWIAALSEAGLPVPTPVPDRHGRAYHSAGGHLVAIYRWTQGQVRETVSRRDAQAIGELLARMQNHADGWRLPEGTERARVDRWDRATTDDEALANIQARYGDLPQAATAVREYRAWERDQPRPLIHGDLHQGNLVRTPKGGFAVIDFDDCGFAPTLYDLAVPAREFRAAGKPELIEVMVEAFARHREPPDLTALPLVERYRAAQLLHWVATSDQMDEGMREWGDELVRQLA